MQRKLVKLLVLFLLLPSFVLITSSGTIAGIIAASDEDQAKIDAIYADINVRLETGEIFAVMPDSCVELHNDFLSGKISEDDYCAKSEDIILAIVREKNEAAFRAQFTDEEWADYLVYVDECERNITPDGCIVHEYEAVTNGTCVHNWEGQGGTYSVNNPKFEPTTYCHYFDRYYYYEKCLKCGETNMSPPPFETVSKRHPQPVFYNKPGGGQGTKCPDCGYIFS